MPIPPFDVRPTTADDWAEYRDLRREMLADSPDAYRQSLADANQLTERDWRRLTGGDPRASVTMAVETQGRWIGSAAAYLRSGAAVLVAVYVAPDARGQGWGVLDALLGAVEDWARERVTRVVLSVREENVRARRAYERRGYEPVVDAARGDAAGPLEITMEKRLARPV